MKGLAGVDRALDRVGEWITLRRLTGTTQATRVPFDVRCRAFVAVGQVEMLIGGVQMTGDKITITRRELDAARWPGRPQTGDQVIYGDGRTAAVQGRAMAYRLGPDEAYVFSVLGA